MDSLWDAILKGVHCNSTACMGYPNPNPNISIVVITVWITLVTLFTSTVQL